VSVSIAVINESTVVTDAQVTSWVPALQAQVTDHFLPAWGTDAQLTFVPNSQAPPLDAWQLVVLDDSDQAGALGYHDLTSAGLPLAKVFAQSDQQAGSSISVTCSHELLEMLGDPMIDTTVLFQDNAGNVAAFAFEACDACEADQYGYDIGGVLVSDFVYPSWFDQRPNPGGVPAGALDYGQHLTQALTLASPLASVLPGGYIGMWTPNGGWTQVAGQDRQADYYAIPQRGSRRERRMRRSQWMKSLSYEQIAARRSR
jgi:hypothetical protein